MPPKLSTNTPKLISFCSTQWQRIDTAPHNEGELMWGINMFDPNEPLPLQDPYLMRWSVVQQAWFSRGNFVTPSCWQPVIVSDRWKLRADEATTIAQAKGAPITI